ncbi:rod shape-determining protein MreC [Arcobacter lanthieri]|uniref:rod shape-determining protein MreC n=1 Tax=Aliarcobacter lanthieri TaxID=1355374 RepID=UPI0019242C99|nr:rod shape-determining protein MreC [Aliarcobacter lanthieri]MBL3519132.1 rod shape-determining protein MreC [Aliarcobacter lanthieri]
MKRILFIFLFLIAGLAYLFELDKFLAKHFSIFSTIKTTYINTYISVSEKIANHFEHERMIKELQTENIELKEYKILYNESHARINNFKEFIKNVELPDVDSKIEIIRVLSYINFDDFTNVWLDRDPEPNNKILGLISENYASGIALNKQGKLIGLLNGNKDCTYAVFIGADKSPGIVTAADKLDELFVKFIPIWADIHIGDEVITSGMDNIFFEGLKVGKVTEIKEFPDMKIATIKPYASPLKKRYFYTYKKINNLDDDLKNPEEIKKLEENLNN